MPRREPRKLHLEDGDWGWAVEWASGTWAGRPIVWIYEPGGAEHRVTPGEIASVAHPGHTLAPRAVREYIERVLQPH